MDIPSSWVYGKNKMIFFIILDGSKIFKDFSTYPLPIHILPSVVINLFKFQ